MQLNSITLMCNFTSSDDRQASNGADVVDGDWTSWVSRGCSVTCGLGNEQRVRQCVRSGSSDAAPCVGSAMRIGPCRLADCESSRRGILDWFIWIGPEATLANSRAYRILPMVALNNSD